MYLEEPRMDNRLEVNVAPEIEAFVVSVACNMGRVPDQRRDELLTELRVHLATQAEDFESDGQSKPEAHASAIKMMGSPQSLGRSYARMWYRSTEPGTFLSSLGVMAVVVGIGSAILNPLIHRTLDSPSHSGLIGALGLANLLAGRVCPAIVSGWLTPKYAVRATVFNTLVYAVSTWFSLPHYHVHDVLSALVADALISASCVLVARATTRVRMLKLAGI
jgi:hypothetical protein